MRRHKARRPVRCGWCGRPIYIGMYETELEPGTWACDWCVRKQADLSAEAARLSAAPAATGTR